MVNRNRRQAHAYNPDEMASNWLRRVPLPLRLKCDMCERNYNAANFSQKQLTDVRYQISTMGKITKNPKCFKCTGHQLVELECYMCHKTKGLEAFAKSQRSNPEEARCYACTEIQLAREPVHETTYDDPKNAFVRTEDPNGNYYDYFASSNSIYENASSVGEYEDTESNDGGHRRREDGGIELLNNSQHIMSINSQEPNTLIQSEFSHPVDGARPGTWSQVAGTRSWHTPTVASSNAHSSFEPNRFGRPGADTASVHSFNSSFAERSQAGSDRTEMRNGFAKIKAYKPPPRVDPWVDNDKNNSSSSDSDNDDNDDDDYTVI